MLRKLQHGFSLWRAVRTQFHVAVCLNSIMNLNHFTAFTLWPKSPFQFDATVHKPSHFPNTLKLNDWEPGRYWQSFRFGKQQYGLKLTNEGTTDAPKVAAAVYSPHDLTAAEVNDLMAEISWRFELDTDLTEFTRFVRQDERFAPLFEKWVGMRAASHNTLYELMVIALTLQNATVRRSQQMLDALLGQFGSKVVFAGKELWAIWLPEELEQVSEDDLRRLKIGYRAKFLKRLSADFANGTIDERALRSRSKADALARLLKLYGVGPETARILLFEAYHHYDVFDHIAPWQQKIYSRLFYDEQLVPTERIREDVLKQYGTYAMLAVHYIWEDVFWRRQQEHIDWLEKEIRL
jgi:3-methyladenine DNA glycosylase/8-oxoguanine DNA glycosylase